MPIHHLTVYWWIKNDDDDDGNDDDDDDDDDDEKCVLKMLKFSSKKCLVHPTLKVLLLLPLVILQAIVYSLLLLFVHPRPEPRTMSLVETVSLCSRGGFLFVSCLTTVTLLLIVTFQLRTACLHQAMLFVCCVQDYQQHILWLLASAQSPAMTTLLLAVLHSKSMPSPGPIIHKMKLITFFITCACKPKDFMVTIVSGTVLLPCLKNNRNKKPFPRLSMCCCIHPS